MTFDPGKYVLDLRGKKYLPVFARVLAFRDIHPDGSIVTEMLNLDPPVFKATIIVDGIAIATGHATAVRNERAVWAGHEIEKAETAAVGRALANAGFGTEYEPEDLDNPADAPIEVQPKRAAAPPPAPAPKSASSSLDENPYKKLMSKPRQTPSSTLVIPSLVEMLKARSGLGDGEFNSALTAFLLGQTREDVRSWHNVGVRTPQDAIEKFMAFIASQP